MATLERIDVTTYTDEWGEGIDPLFREVKGRRVTLEQVARRLDTENGFFEDDPDYGYDVRAQLGRRMTDRDIIEIQSAIERQAELEVGVREAKAQITFDHAARAVAILLRLVDADGPFRGVLSIDQVTTKILEGPP